MPRIDPKDDELGMMENVSRGVRHVPAAENPPSDQASAPPVSEPQPEGKPASALYEPGATVNAVSTENPPSATQSPSSEQITEPKS
jgi:hypothetical protein